MASKAPLQKPQPFPSDQLGLDLALIHAARSDDAESVSKLLALGADATARDCIGSTALMVAAAWGRPGCVELLIGHSDPDARDIDGETALIVAIRRGHEHCAKLLLPASDLSIRTADGQSALDCARRHSYWRAGIFQIVEAEARMRPALQEAAAISMAIAPGRPRARFGCRL